MYCEFVLAAALSVCGQPAEAAASKNPVAEESAPAAESLQSRYARARLRLAQMNLRRVAEINRRLQRSIPASVVAEFRRDVQEANLQVEQAAPDAKGGEFAVWLGRAQSQLQAATTRWKNALAGNRRVKGTFEEVDVERFRLQVEVARLQLERGQELAAAPRADQLEWQVELLNNEVDRLRQEQMRATPAARYFPIYWFW